MQRVTRARRPHTAYFSFDESTVPPLVGPHLRPGPDDALLLITDTRRRDELGTWLRAAGCDIAGMSASGRFAWCDSRATLDVLLAADGAPDAGRFAQTVGAHVEEVVRRAPSRHVKAFGDMVSLLVADGRPGAALRLEELWNELARRHDISLCCAYDATVLPAGTEHAVDELCDTHDSLLLPPEWQHITSMRDRRRIVDLQCRAAIAERERAARDRAERDLSIAAAAGAALARCLAVHPSRVSAVAPSTPIMIWAAGPDGLCHYFNDGWLTFTGRSATQEMGNGWAEGVHPDDLARCLETYTGALARRVPFQMEYRIRRHDSAYRRIVDAGVPRFDSDGTFAGYVGGCIDITELHSIQEARDQHTQVLERVVQHWTRTVDSLDLAVFIIDHRGRVNRLNRAALQLSGADRYEDVTGRRFEQIGSGEPWTTARAIAIEAAAGRAGSRSIQCDGRSWDIGAARMPGEGDAGLWSIVSLRETSEVTKLQEALRRSEAMAAVGTLIAGVAHEVRNPLFGISATLQLFESRLGDRREFHECSALLHANTERLMTLMRDLLDYARPVPPTMGEVHLADVIEEAIDACGPQARERGITVEASLSPTLEPLHADRGRLVQVFQNVIHNAVFFSPSGSSVHVAAAAKDDSVIFDVEDAGPGFRPDEIPHVFEPFFTKRRDGTGLGLSIARRIVEAHSGSIEAANSGAGGARIRITLPRRAATARAGA